MDAATNRSIVSLQNPLHKIFEFDSTNNSSEKSPQEFTDLLTAENVESRTLQQLTLLHVICAGHSESVSLGFFSDRS